MNAPAPTLAPELAAQAEQAERLAQAGNTEAAAHLFERILVRVPDYSRGLSFFAMQAFSRGDLTAARRLIEQASEGSPRSALVEANRALVLRAQGETEHAAAALEAALQLDPEFVPVRLDLGALYEQLGRTREANLHYQRALQRLPAIEAVPAGLRERVERANASLARERQELAAAVAARLQPLRENLPTEQQVRFEECLQIVLGNMRPKVPKPGFMYFPKLPPLTFYPRQMFDWAPRAEAATDRVREEIAALLAADDDSGFIPYVQKPPEDAGPGSPWNPLNRSRDWGAYFLFNQGEKVARHCAACPATTALLESLPQVLIPGRAPTAFFSRLKPGTHIPAHHGATNTRLVVHLPLIVPPDCAIRVGNDVRQWREGELLIFDDTIEHEAWNRSDQTRVVLIFDVWNPYLSDAERELVTATTAAFADFYPGRQHEIDT